MTKTVSLNEVSIQSVIALTRNSDEVIVEEDGEPVTKITPIEKPELKQRILGFGAEKGYFMSDDFDEQISINQ